MAVEDRAAGYVKRADAALADLETAEQVWTDSIRSNTDEMRLHSLSIELDNAIRKVQGKFETWDGLDPAVVAAVSGTGPINLLWALSAHPSGRIREAFVHTADGLGNDQVLPHLANRSIDFVPAIRDLAGPIVISRLDAILTERIGPENQGVLPTSAHIAVQKLLSPRTAVVNPELIRTCIALAETSGLSRPGSLSSGKLYKMLERCQQTMASSSDPATSEAIEALIAHFNANAVPAKQPETQ